MVGDNFKEGNLRLLQRSSSTNGVCAAKLIVFRGTTATACLCQSNRHRMTAVVSFSFPLPLMRGMEECLVSRVLFPMGIKSYSLLSAQSLSVSVDPNHRPTAVDTLALPSAQKQRRQVVHFQAGTRKSFRLSVLCEVT